MSLPVFFLALLCIQHTLGGFVFAHYMLGNAYPSDVASFGRNIALAKAAGIDGFALNIGPDDWMPDRIAKMYEAARQAGGFKLFISFDMAVLPPNGDTLVNYARQYASHPASFFYQGKYFMSTFAGENVNFGESSVNLGWQRRVKDPLANAGIQICLVPSFTAMGPVDFFEKLPVLDGAFSWAGWSNGNSLKTTEEDDIYIAGAKKNGKIYMAPVSPWFFTHFSYKNWIFKSEGLYPHRWEQILKMNVPLVEIITWNDYGEAHYIGPIDGDMPPEARVWTTGFDHQAWTDLSVAYIKAYKAGSQTAIIEKESVFFWHRVHSKYADRGDGVPRPDHWDWADDDIVVHTQLLSPADITVVNGGKSQTFRANAGANTFQIPFVEGQVFVSAARDGADLGGLRSYRDIQNAGNGYNFNPAVNKFDLKSTPKPQIPPPVAPPPVNTNQPNSAFVYLGCGIDAEQRAMDPQVYQIDGMTPTKCYERCKSLGKQYFGVEYHTECYCADQPFSKGQSAEADCNTPCGGDANTICGGGWRLSVYQIKSSTPPPNPCQNVIYGSQPNTDWWFTVSGVTGESAVQMKCNGGNLISCEKNGWGDRYACAAKGNPCGGSRNAVITKSDGSGQFECPLSLPNGNREAGQEEEGQSPAPGLAGYAIALIVIAVVVVVVLIVVATYLALRNKRSTQDERF